MKKRIIRISLTIIIIFLITWPLLPVSFSNVMPIDEDTTISFSANAMVNYHEETYSINIPESQKDSLEEILEILKTSRYRQDYRNLLPWRIGYVDADKNYDGHTVHLMFVYGNAKDEYVTIQFMSSSIIAVSTKDTCGFRIYHPTNDKTIYALVEYLKTHGTIQ